jgi:hypothetical protein
VYWTFSLYLYLLNYCETFDTKILKKNPDILSKNRPFSTIVRALDCESDVLFILFWSWNPFHDHLYLTLLWHVLKFQFLAKVKATATGKFLDSWRQRIMWWLNCALLKIKMANCSDLEGKLPSPLIINSKTINTIYL